MQSKNEEFVAELKTNDNWNEEPRSLRMYEQYSQRDVMQTIRTRRDKYEKADVKAKRKLETDVEAEVIGFAVWLEETKGLDSSVAHYYAISLKSLLLGLPEGMKIAQLFNLILNNCNSSIH
jgi:hypothetical protein